MSDEQNPAGGTPPPAAPAVGEELKNFKAEVSRKLDNYTQEFKKLAEQMATSVKPPAPVQETKKLGQLVYEDADAYTEKVLQEADARAEALMAKREEQQAKQQAVIASLVTDFPELSQGDSELTRKALEIYGTLSAEEKASPSAYKLAVKDAALELGVVPKSKRKAQSDDTFAMGGTDNSRRPARVSEVDEATKFFAEMLGRDPAKVKEVTKKRKNFSSWE